MPHRRQTVALLSSLYILNVLHFNKTNTEVMAGYDVGSLSQYVITVKTDADVKLESNVTAAAFFSI